MAVTAITLPATPTQVFTHVTINFADGTEGTYEIHSTLPELAANLQFAIEGARIMRGTEVTSFALAVVIDRDELPTHPVRS